MLKKFFSAIVCAAMVIGLTGCGNNPADTPASEKMEAAGTPIPETAKMDTAQQEDREETGKSTFQEEELSEPEKEFDIYHNQISGEAKRKAETFADVSAGLPDWKGTHIVDKAEFAWSWACTQSNPEMVSSVEDTQFDELTVREIAEAGYNFVRVALDTRYFFTEERYNELSYVGQEFYGSIDTENATQYEELDRLIQWCIENDIHVCIDCHSTAGGLMIGGDEEASRKELFEQGSEEQAIFVRFWEILANRYADIDTNALSFNLYNEPPFFATDCEDIYIDLMNRAAEAIQTVTPDRLIIVDAMEYSTKGINMVDQLKVNNLVIGFHLYADGTTNTEMRGLEPNADNQELWTLNLEACNQEAIGRLEYYDNWAKENEIRWMLQEYGCSTYIQEEDQESYYHTIIDTCKEMEVPYCLWTFNGGDFGLCIWTEDDFFDTPGAVYEENCGGHRINKVLADITSQ